MQTWYTLKANKAKFESKKYESKYLYFEADFIRAFA